MHLKNLYVGALLTTPQFYNMYSQIFTHCALLREKKTHYSNIYNICMKLCKNNPR